MSIENRSHRPHAALGVLIAFGAAVLFIHLLAGVRYGFHLWSPTDHPDILVCRHLSENWPDFWKKFRRYG